ncbi:hypothetical protein TIFTF001_001057 [Ficus carica]|uniref:Uncharacterized protein n=1 Tax=Ficus carica TaxID=3494 RepID=A0AA88CQC7_FICCA|nr:hypothetical protein TIFTF001_001057 [Ficus carica]
MAKRSGEEEEEEELRKTYSISVEKMTHQDAWRKNL